ncbi:polyhydroxyalkanoate synthesis repressor PhaR [Inhella gelatinilytica]|uniref:Polyhydroxyalkanoate synthesis repressor PhaR n=1 Tax=Inhella gelatinilytica TaxID=2795030 RepID=A0A931NFA7_9BURK|nr:polyhydroxyalkanoate synthesis repressor PhaR [Inhella gelatinilytica]MBH9554060.1 polyhydroxyalkanoate synthesis repressor PhaR [Inhella gelatinilytica]
MATRRRAAAPDAEAASPTAAPRVLKKYPNRRLYDTQTSAYVTLQDVKAMVLDGQHFEVRDAKTGEDLTRAILLQIILEEETGGVPLFSTPMLEQIIRFYGQAMQGVLQDYLAKNLQTFADMQQRFAEQSGAMGLTPEAWAQFMQGQAPMMQGLMGNYFEQSKNLFVQMQEQMAKGALFPGVPGFGKTK